VDLEELYEKVKYLENLEEIKKLQRKYQYWLYKQDYEKIVERCFARKTPGIRMEASDSGVFKGKEGVKRFFLGFMGSKRDVPGFFTMHLAVGPVIEIAKDGKTAKSIWFSPGCAGEPMWIWGVYMIDYVNEDGEWKLWHVNFNPLFRTPYDKGWVEVPISGTTGGGLADEPPSRWNPYDKSKKGQELFHHLLDAPEPYDSMDME
jgi:hypothetical protein